MRCKTLTAAAAVLLMLTAGCSTLEKVVYRPDINQGNYLTPNDVSKIRVGMTQQQVAYAPGNPDDVRSVRHKHLVLCIPPAAWS